MLSFLGALSVVLEGLELIGPQRLHLVEPRLQGDERSRAQPVHAKTRIMGVLILFDFDEATRCGLRDERPSNEAAPADCPSEGPRQSRNGSGHPMCASSR